MNVMLLCKGMEGCENGNCKVDARCRGKETKDGKKEENKGAAQFQKGGYPHWVQGPMKLLRNGVGSQAETCFNPARSGISKHQAFWRLLRRPTNMKINRGKACSWPASAARNRDHLGGWEILTASEVGKEWDYRGGEGWEVGSGLWVCRQDETLASTTQKVTRWCRRRKGEAWHLPEPTKPPTSSRPSIDG